MVFFIAMGLSLGLVSFPAQAHPEHRKYKKLVRDGPSIASLGQVIRFRALAKGGEPLVVDFQLAGDGYLKLVIKGSGRTRSTFEFPAKAGSREIDMKTLPAEFGAWQAARWTVTAFDDSGEEIEYRFFGIGVGDRAVGSTGIWQVTFWPPEIRNTESADWGFKSKHDFERAGIVIYRWEDGAGYWRESQTLDSKCQPKRGEGCKGNWDGADGKGARSKGRHRVAVKAWQSKHEKDWIIEISEEQVAVK
jgi:hypothetical protein